MHCIKTGAQLFVEEIGAVVPADIYAVGSEGIVARWLPDCSKTHCSIAEAKALGATHVITMPYGQSEDWCRKDIGVIVTQRLYLIGETCE